MYKKQLLLKSIIKSQSTVVKNGLDMKYNTKNGSPKLEFKKCLLVCKLSRYSFERYRNRKLNKSQLEKVLRNQGVDYEQLMHYHEVHKSFHKKLAQTMKEMSVEVRFVTRMALHRDDIKWADIVIPSGGDGTFLLAASKILHNSKPVIGFNSDPNSSIGHLCLPKKYTSNVKEVFERLRAGNFKWLMRSRIRTILGNQDQDHSATDLHELGNHETQFQLTGDIHTHGKVLPCLALNEVFLGETLSSRVSHLQMNIDDQEETTNLKCSGICVSTGTGSSSWNFNINSLSTQTVTALLHLIKHKTGIDKTELANELAKTYNCNLVFNPECSRMYYTIRELITTGLWPSPKGIKSRGMVYKVKLRSSCYDAGLIIDGGISFSFNDRTVAILQIHPEDALRTVVLSD